MTRTAAIEWVVFDAGLVLFDLRPDRFFQFLADHGRHDRDVVAGRVFAPGSDLDRYERGELSTSDFLAGVRADFAPAAELDDIERAFCEIVVPYAESAEILSTVASQASVGLLSDTSPLHFHQCVMPLTGSIAAVQMTSFVAKAKKPSASIFLSFLEAAATDAPVCLFIDDKPANVAAARDLGFQAEQACGPDEVRRALGRYSLGPAAG